MIETSTNDDGADGQQEDGEGKTQQPEGENKQLRGPKGPKFLPPLKKKLMSYGDKVVAFFDPQTQFLLLLQQGKTFDCKYGHFLHANFVGKEYGSKVHNR